MFLSRKPKVSPPLVQSARGNRSTDSAGRRHVLLLMRPNEERARFITALERAGVRVTLADSVEDAMRQGSGLAPVGVLLVDHALVGPDIFSVVQRVKAWPPLYNAATVVVTNRCSQALLIAGVARGIGQFIERPTQARDVVERVERVLRRAAEEPEDSGVYLTRR